MAFVRTAADLADSDLRGIDFPDLLADEDFFLLDDCEDSQLVLFPPADAFSFLPRFVVAVLLAEREKRCSFAGSCEQA